MSHQRLRHFVLALILGSVPLLPPVTAQAAPAAKIASSTASSAPQESAVLRKFRDSAPPVMAEMARHESTARPSAYRSAGPIKYVPLQAVNNPRLYREVFGFAFASSLGDPNIGYPSWNFSLLSTVAYFGIHVDWTGDFSAGSALNTWNDANGAVPGFIQAAHASGTKVVLTIAMFDSTNGTPDMCSALQRANVTIQRTVSEITAKGIDGVNVDYESNNTMCTDPATGGVQSSQSLFTNFVAQLHAALPASGNYLSVDTYSGAAGYRDSTGAYLGFFDIGALANYADSFFVMAYDMEYANWDSPPLNCPSFCIGPTAPLSTYLFNDGRASSEYRAVVPASKIIMGIPYYGRKECVAINPPDQIPPNAIGTSVGADGYLDASTESTYPGNTQYTTHRESRDPLSATRWDTFSSTAAGCNREIYWDDTVALGNKYNLVINDHLRGAGIFALNYGGGAPELWNLINLKFGQCSEAAITADHTTPQIPGTTITFTGTALCAGTGTFRFWMQTPGGAFQVVQDYSTTTTWTWSTSSQPLGTYTFQVDARNLGSTGLDTYMRTTFRLALCVTPTEGVSPASPQLPGTAIAVTATVTCQGTPEYRFWVLPPGGTWTIAQDYGSASTFKWDTTHLAYGDYGIGVHVRTAGTAVAYESVQSSLVALRSCIATGLTTDKASPQPTGTTVVLHGSAQCDGTAQFRFMIQPPGGSWAVVQDFGSGATYNWVGSGPGGTYSLEVDAKSSAAPIGSMLGAQRAYDLSGCSAATLATSPASPQMPGVTVTLTGSATCPGTAQYRFWMHKPDGTNLIIQDYSAANTFSWTTTGFAFGQYGLRVDARNLGATAAYEAKGIGYYTLADPACTTPTVTIDPPSAQGVNTIVTFTAATTTCPLPLYEFWLKRPGSSSWTLGQGYSASPLFHWNTRGAQPGDYQISAWVRDTYSGTLTTTGLGSYDAFLGVADTLTSTPCTSPSISASPPTPTTSGTPVAITASSTCAHANPLYQFWMLAAGSSSWQIVQPYSTSATYNWNTSGASGVERLGVWVRDTSSSGTNISSLGSYDALAGTAYGVNTSACTQVSAAATPSPPSPSGTVVTIKAQASSCPNPVYEFWLRAAGSSTWQVLRGYSTSNTFTWDSTGGAAGSTQFGVWVRDTSLSTAYDTYAAVPYSLTVTPCTSVSASATPPSPSTAGTLVTISGAAAGCTKPLYEFWMLAPGSTTWTVVQGYWPGASFTWDSTGKPAGVYHFSVWVRDYSSAGAKRTGLGAYDAFTPFDYTLS